ncbi:low molecular weight phosphotyrosine protein phosphatase [Nonomuraea sp. NN258]|uniref:low molecular weight protein-tyrosine-phosphatase n=1 Tax=Nonomuraea antri TaxID=2730852 RepID=UPI001568567B|nr:low molecular weight protein-tyrosine-phosphatase [Nonomuraea antri]NRQ39053.1 low molecular weight phosphotyrosine protein phosphatase [Nonomuraea antri]
MAYRICVVCMANYCRSPMAEVVLRAKLAAHGLDGRVIVESAGTEGWFAGSGMDEQALETLTRFGYDGSAHRARQFAEDWFGRYDLVLAMDRVNQSALRRLAPAGAHVRLFRSFDPSAPEGAEMPDPYRRGEAEFERVFGLIESAAEGIAGHLARIVR